MSDIKNVRIFLFEFKDGTELKLVEKENYDKLVERIKELEEENSDLRIRNNSRIVGTYAEVRLEEIIKDEYISKQKVKEILDKAELMDYYTLPNVIEDLEKLLKEGV